MEIELRYHVVRHRGLSAERLQILQPPPCFGVEAGSGAGGVFRMTNRRCRNVLALRSRSVEAEMDPSAAALLRCGGWTGSGRRLQDDKPASGGSLLPPHRRDHP